MYINNDTQKYLLFASL